MELKMMYFKAPWCGPCRMTSPVVEELKENSDVLGVDIEIINVDENQELAAEYGIRSIPTFVFFKDGEEIDRQVGAVQKGQLLERFDSMK